MKVYPIIIGFVELTPPSQTSGKRVELERLDGLAGLKVCDVAATLGRRSVAVGVTGAVKGGGIAGCRCACTSGSSVHR